MNTYCSFQSVNLYKYTKPHYQGRMYKYALLRKTGIFGAKNAVNKIYKKNSIFFLLFSVINFT